MGKATQLDDVLDTSPLTSAELRERQTAKAIGDLDVEVTLEGDLVKRQRWADAPIVVRERETATWD